MELEKYISTHELEKAETKDEKLKLIEEMVKRLGGEFFQYVPTAGQVYNGASLLFLPYGLAIPYSIEQRIEGIIDVHIKYVDKPIVL